MELVDLLTSHMIVVMSWALNFNWDLNQVCIQTSAKMKQKYTNSSDLKEPEPDNESSVCIVTLSWMIIVNIP